MGETLSQVQRKQLGVFYTPEAICRTMIHDCLAPLVEDEGRDWQSLRILDPACGEGAFLMEVCRFLDRRFVEATPHQRQAAWRQRLVEHCVHGVDVDAQAVESLRRKLVTWIAPSPQRAEAARAVVCRNICVGDALTGADFHESTPSARCGKDSGRLRTDPIDWSHTFAAVAAAGGFDAVVGNPPYLRERNAKAVFDRIATTPLGQRWRQARMDLWYYFLHRGLDLLRPEGRLAFIVNSYWTGSAGARRLIERLERETTIERVTLLGNARIFRNVAGRHLILQIQKARHSKPCRIVDCSNGTGPSANVFHLPQRSLFVGGTLVLRARSEWIASLQELPSLDTAFDVRQGMAENPAKISHQAARTFSGPYRAREGVFVLTREEVDRLALSEPEQQLLRPYYANTDLGRYRIPTRSSHYVLYLTRTTAPNLDDYPAIEAHLKRFRPILERRRECRRGKIRWWHLHWPREERIFAGPSILGLQMGAVPQFVWAPEPAYVGFSVNLILHRTGLPLPVLTGILNSKLANEWFQTFAKRRGIHLDISGTLLRRFPCPDQCCGNLERQIAECVARRQQLDTADSTMSAKIAQLESNIDRAVCRLYGITPADVIT